MIKVVTNDASLVRAALLGASAGLLGASLGWFVMSNQIATGSAADLPAVRATEPQADPTAEVSHPITAPDPAPAARAARSHFYLQVATYRHEDGAQESAERLQELGFEVQLREESRFHRLLVGPFDSEEAVAGAGDRLTTLLGVSRRMRRTIPGPWLTVELEKRADL